MNWITIQQSSLYEKACNEGKQLLDFYAGLGWTLEDTWNMCGPYRDQFTFWVLSTIRLLTEEAYPKVKEKHIRAGKLILRYPPTWIGVRNVYENPFIGNQLKSEIKKEEPMPTKKKKTTTKAKATAKTKNETTLKQQIQDILNKTKPSLQDHIGEEITITFKVSNIDLNHEVPEYSIVTLKSGESILECSFGEYLDLAT